MHNVKKLDAECLLVSRGFFPKKSTSVQAVSGGVGGDTVVLLGVSKGGRQILKWGGQNT